MTNKERVAQAIKEYSGINPDYLESLGFKFEDDAECFVFKKTKTIAKYSHAEIEINLFESKTDNMLWIDDNYCCININSANDIIILKRVLSI